MTVRDNTSSAGPTSKVSERGPLNDLAFAQLRAWDPAWADTCERMALNPWKHEVLPCKTIELIGLAINAACTNLNPEGTQRHIRAALDAGANRDEILMVLKMASLLSIHSCSLGAPILLEEARRLVRGSWSIQSRSHPCATNCARWGSGTRHGHRSITSTRSGQKNSSPRESRHMRAAYSLQSSPNF